MNRKSFFRRMTAFFILCTLLCGSCFAASVDVTPKQAKKLTADVFAGSEGFSGIYISALPSEDLCTVLLRNRVLREGDVLDASCLSDLAVRSTGLVQVQTQMEYRAITDGVLCEPQTVSFRLLKAQDTAPTAEDGCFTTYKNVCYTGTLTASDEDGDVLTYAIVKQPKRGSIALSEDGTFVYTPLQNKVGKDRFTFTAADPDGHVSEAATVEIEIRKPLDDAQYTDMCGTTDELYAVWLRENGAFSGKTVGGSYVFEPNAPVTRAEFLVMAMNAFGAQPETEYRKTGFADELDAPASVRPYMAQALRCGYISGSRTEAGLVFRPDEQISFAEAAVMTQNIAKLPKSDAKTVSAMGGNAIPAWAQSAVSALSEAGISLAVPEDGSITRLGCAKLLYEAAAAKK